MKIKDKDVIDLKIRPEEWHRQSPRWGNPLHSICSYMASFPPKLPHYFIDRFTNVGDLVLDPFSGRGTTVLEAALMGRKAIGNDLNPIAYVLTKAKLQIPNLSHLKKRIKVLKEEFEESDISDIPDDIKMLYSEKVLQQLKFLKETLDYRRRSTDTFILALILGAMHGNSRSSKPSYLSIPMPNTFSMSPRYVRKYIKEHNLKPPKHDVFDVLEYRINKLFSRNTKWRKDYVRGKAYNQDIRNIKRIMKNQKADLIFTSPPYLKVIRYGRMNWIRLWLLGVDPKELDEKLDDKHTLPKYLKFMKETLDLFYDILADDGLAFVVVGDVNSAKTKNSVVLGEIIQKELENTVNFEFINIINDYYNNDFKVSRIWGAKKGKATKYDQILVLAKDVDALKNKKFKDHVDW